jgi:hypothetical protein
VTTADRRRLVRELAQALPAEQRRHAVTAVANAIRDLRGSINSEALPEMAYKLALVRLNELSGSTNR